MSVFLAQELGILAIIYQVSEFIGGQGRYEFLEQVIRTIVSGLGTPLRQSSTKPLTLLLVVLDHFAKTTTLTMVVPLNHRSLSARSCGYNFQYPASKTIVGNAAPLGVI